MARFLVYKFPLMSHLYPQYQMVIFANAPKGSSICTFFIFKVIDMPFSFAVSKSFYIVCFPDIFCVIFITLSALVNLIFYYLKAILHSYLVHASQTNVLMLGLHFGSPSVYPDMFSANISHFGTLLHLLYISNTSFTFAHFSPSR